MLRRSAQYAFAFVALCIACAVYQLTFVSWLEPGILPEIAMAGAPALREDRRLAHLFPEDSWQRGNCKRLQTRDVVLLFENWQQLSDDQWKLWPVSVVLGSQSESPLVLNAIEGAEIKFTESLDVMSGGAPPIERGRMIGRVSIHSIDQRTRVPDDDAQRDDRGYRRIEIEASEVGIDHRKIWTTQPIRLQIGDAKLTGSDLTLHLSTAGGMMATGDNALSVLDRLELVYLDELTVPLADGGLWAPPAAKRSPVTNVDAAGSPIPSRPVPIGRLKQVAAPELAANSSDAARSPGLASVRCGGFVVFQFGTGELTLQDRVELRHQPSIHLPVVDSFTCDVLKLKFADLMARKKESEEFEDYLLSMVASGHPVRASLPSFDAELAAGQIELDTRARLVRMSGPAGVLVSYAGNRWQFSEVNYLIHPDDPKRLGTFDSSGPGGMDVADSMDVPVRRLRWNSGVKLQELSTPGTLSLRVDGDVKAAMSDGGTFGCDSALLVLQQTEGDKPQLSPKQFQATGKPALLETPVIAISTRLLQLYFEVESGPVKTEASGSDSLASSSANNNSLRQWVKQPGEDRANAQLASTSTPIVRSRPTIHGNTITARLHLAAGNVTARDLNVDGDVSLRHEIQTQAGPLPATLTGQQFVLRDGGGNDVIQIGSGINDPARFELGDGYFIGPLIQVRLADNVVWIKDAGEFQMPTQVLPRVGTLATPTGMKPLGVESTDTERGAGDSTGSSSSPLGGKIEWVSAPKCRWKGQMVFDGKTAIMTDGVDIHATMVSGEQRDVWDLNLTGDQLQMVLDQDVQVREVASVKSATIDHISITSSADHPLLVTANQLDAIGNRKARHVLAAPELILKPQSGTLSGPGPGWYRAWMATGQSSPFAQSGPLPTAEANPKQMFGIHLVYQQTLEANMPQKSIDFLQGVRIAGRAVTSWDDLIDVTQMQGLRLGESTLDCDRLRLALDDSKSWVPASQSWEMEAMQNVAFQTRIEKGLFNGTADRASYAASKNLFLIEGVPGRAAVMNQTLPTGQPGISFSVKRMAVNPKTMEAQNIELDRFGLGTLPSTLGR